MSTAWLVTGSSRGIGLELVRQIAADASNVVFATCRNPSSATKLKTVSEEAKGKVHIVQLDASDVASIKAAAATVTKTLGSQGLNYVINNAAGQSSTDVPSTLEVDSFLADMKLNVAGPAIVAQNLMPLLERAAAAGGRKPVVCNMSSGMGSIAMDLGARMVSYSITKSSINMLTYKQAKESPNVIWIAQDPGWVKTDMGGPGAQLEVDFSASSILKVLTTVTEKDSGSFRRYNGDVIPY